MSERQPKHPEGAEFQPTNPEHEGSHEQHNVVDDTAETSAEKSHGSVEDISKKVEQHAVSGEQRPSHESEQHDQPVAVNHQLKSMSYDRAMTRVRKHLSAPSRAFSKVLHSPLVDKPSELASKTIARPSGMLGGGLVAMVGTLLLFWIVNRYGYEYNYLLIGVFFVSGMTLGLLAEGALKLLRKR